MKTNQNRRSGILLHPTALPSSYGIGDLGPEAYKFVDLLYDTGQRLWQVLPLGPTDYSNSPYSSLSTFAGNHLLISFDLLESDGLLDSKYLIVNQPNSNKVNFKEVKNFKLPILKMVAKNFKNNASEEFLNAFDVFCEKEFYWLNDYSKYYVLKEQNEDENWFHWESDVILDVEKIEEAKILQFLFHYQWELLRQYCNSKEVQIIGDMPIYVSYNSSDVFFNKNLFELDKNGKMSYQSGVPPCKFQINGQLWKTPIYDWEAHKQTNFKWWKQRFSKLFEMVDLIRLDHFIGYAKYFKISIESSSAQGGVWVNGPGEAFFDELSSSFNEFNVVVEDLGDVTEDVVELREKFKFPGMKVLQFEFESIPFNINIDENSLLCTGTHDNDTIIGWFNSLPYNSDDKNILTQDKILDFFNCEIDDLHWEIINYAFKSSSNIVILPIQDIIGKNSDARFNIPGTLSEDNWAWKLQKNQLLNVDKSKLLELTKLNNRNYLQRNETVLKHG